MILDSTLKSLEVLLGGAITTSQLPIFASYVDVTTTTYVPGSADLPTNNATAVTPVAAPAVSTQRQIKFLSVYNADTVPQTVTIRLNNNGTFRTLIKPVLAVGSTITYTDGEGFVIIDANGNRLTSSGTSSAGSGAWTVISNSDTGTQNNWAPAGLSGNTLIEWNGAADIAITGIAGGVAGQMIRFKNNTAAKLATFADTAGGSSAANQFKNFVTSAPTPTFTRGEITFQHDGTNWKIVDHEQGAWISQAYAGTDFTASAGAWTVDSGDVQIFKYRLEGTTLFVSWALGTTSVSAIALTLAIKIPGGFSAITGGAQSGPQFYKETAGGAYIFGETWISPSVLTAIQLYQTGFGNGTSWQISTNQTATYGTMPIEVA